MRSRIVLVAIITFLSAQLALLPVVEAAVAGPSVSPAPATETAAQAKDQTKQQRKRAAKQKKAKQPQPKKAKQQKAKKQRNKQRARGAAKPSSSGQASARRLPGGRIPSSRQRVAQAQNAGERYIVVFKNDRVDSQVLTTALDKKPGVIPTHIFEHVIKGFAAHLTPAAKRELEQDPRVESVTEDRQVFLAAQTLPRGINRVDADRSSVAKIDGVDQRVDVDIAIIDTGTDLAHPDLNVFAYLDCASDPASPNWGWDLDGHGTHVAGTAAALDNNTGVVGVAPGARIWSFRVMDDAGVMQFSYLIDCMDQVAHYANTPAFGHTIDVANMSLGAVWHQDQCDDLPFNDAVCGMVEAGVTTVVAAGNNSIDAAGFIPANIEQVITVSALADSDGKSGGLGGAYQDACTNPQADDSRASFSNFGAVVDIAAPGVGVLSTFPTYIAHNCVPAAGVGYEIYPGTSMASPHVAGAAGLLLAVNPNLTPPQVDAALTASRENVAISGDDDGFNEGILNVASGPGPDPDPGPGPGDTKGPAVAVRGPAAAKVKQPVTLRVNASDPSGVARVVLYQCQPGCKIVARDAAAPYSFVRRHAQPGRVKYKVRAYDKAGNFTDKFKTINIKPAPKKKPKR